MTFGLKNQCKKRLRFRTCKKSPSGAKKSTFGAAWSRKINEKPSGNILFRENHVFCSGKRFFAILGGKSAMLELILATFRCCFLDYFWEAPGWRYFGPGWRRSGPERGARDNDRSWGMGFRGLNNRLKSIINQLLTINH